MSETKGECRQQLEAWYANNSSSVPRYSWMVADAIDRLAADVASIKAKVDAVSPEDVRHFVEAEKAWVALVTEQRDAAVRERDEARALLELAQVQRTAAYADRDEARAEVYRLKCSMTETSKERDAAIRERDQWREEARLAVINRDEARAEVERLQEELDDREQAEQVKRLREANETLHRKSINYIHDRDQYRRERDQWREEARLAVINRDEARAEVERLKAELAADVAAVKEAVCDGSVAEERDRFLAKMAAAIRERDEARGKVERLRAELAARPAANSSPEPRGWLTEEERELLALVNGMADAYSLDPRSTWRCNWPYSRVSLVVKALLARAGSPPVVVLPSVFQRGSLGDELVALQQVKDSLDKAGVKWKEVPRE